MRHEYFWLRDLMIEKGASKDELEELEECRKKIANFKLKYGFVSHPLKEVRSLKETGHTVAEIAEELNRDKVEVRPIESEKKEPTRPRRPIRYSDYYSNRGRRFTYSDEEATNGEA